MLHRRRFLSATVLAPVALSVAPGLARAEDDPRRAPAPRGVAPSGERPRPADAALREIAPRELELAGDFRIVRAFDVHFGALPFVLEGEGQRFQIDVLRRDPSGPSGVFDTERFSLFVSDHGSPATSPSRERGARALGAALERHYEDAPMPRLASFLERRANHPRDAYEVDFDRVDIANASVAAPS